MDTKKCKHCQSDVSKKASRCPKCQGDLRHWVNRHPVLTLLLGLFGIFIAIAVFKDAPEIEKLNARVNNDASGVTIHNDDGSKWTGCTVRLNGDYRIYADLNPGENFFKYQQFTKTDGTRFDYFSTKPEGASVKCENPPAEW